MGVLEIRNLSATFRLKDGGVHALRGVDLDVAAGSSVSVVGPSGSGKSTLLAVIGGIERPTSGSVRIDGQDLGGLGEDELAAFRGAPKQLVQRENALLKLADLVFTGGPSLYRAKRDRHPQVHCFPSSVDAAHFHQALQRCNDHPLQRSLAQPRLGYYGVIDERIDLELLAAVADATPHWQVCMVGPHVKIDPSSLPRRPNIHYFGQQPYEALPRFVAVLFPIFMWLAIVCEERRITDAG